MSNNKVKVTGYAKRTFFDGGIEYRNFSPDLVGVQLASDGGTPLFTMGNFSITTNLDPKLDKTFTSNKFSDFITLSELDLTLEETRVLLDDNAEVILNLDKTNLDNYALFGSLTEFVRVSLEDIIIKWPASLYVTPVAQTPEGQVLNGFSFEDYSYDVLTNLSNFKIDTNFISNKFLINYIANGSILNTFSATNDLRNLTINFESYVILYNGEFPVVGFTGSTTQLNDFVYFQVQGNVFSGLSTSSKIDYHIKPSKLNVDKFYNALPNFEGYLLNRDIIPAYTAIFKFPIQSETGIILHTRESFTWPVSDGYNIDFNTTEYVTYAARLVDMAVKNDLVKSDLMNRFLVSESISAFDTTPVHLAPLDQDTSGGKMNKTLHIYGRSYDDINQFITGIAFAHTVTYDKQSNTPDAYLKNLASVLGWDLISSVVENNILSNYVSTAESTYSGKTVGLTPVEADIELWRRLILNTPWIWKSKGTRKTIEFLLRFIGTPKGLIQFNEYVYKADGPIDVNLFKDLLTLNGIDRDTIDSFPIDSDGFPRPLPDTEDMYFQNNGLWYRETGGSGATIDILTGNNPHVGPYDGGFKYINQFTNLIPNFSAVTISSDTVTTGSTNLFTNYNLGNITDYTGPLYVDATKNNGAELSECYVVTTTITPDPNPTEEIDNCGCNSVSDDDALNICVDIDDTIGAFTPPPCDSSLASAPLGGQDNGLLLFSYLQYNQAGGVYTVGGNPVLNTTPYSKQTCCAAYGGTPVLHVQVVSGETNTGYVCCDATGKCGCSLSCDWDVSFYPASPNVGDPGSGFPYLWWSDGNGSGHMVTPDGCNCIGNGLTTTVPNVMDPFTGKLGYGCRLTTAGIADLASWTLGSIHATYTGRKNGDITCFEVTIV